MAEASDAWQGPRDFQGFDEYRNKWIIPNLLVDLDTVFLGTRERSNTHKRERVGSGTFILGMALFALFDHLGAFLAKWDPDVKQRESLDQSDNIARTSQLLPSGREVYAIMANLGRNALVHGAWPQTAMEMADDWSFGYTLGAGNDGEHDLLYITWHQQGLRREDWRKVKVLKLAHNVHVLHQEVAEVVKNHPRFRDIPVKAFERIQRYSMWTGVPGPTATNNRSEECEGKAFLKGDITKQQVRKLYAEAFNAKILNDQTAVLYRRTGEVKYFPVQKQEQQ
jgi:hypothetical protein